MAPNNADSADNKENTLQNIFPGIRLYVEDPQVAIKRQIKKTIIIVILILVLGGLLLFFLTSSIKSNNAKLSSSEKLISDALQTQSVDPNLAENLKGLPTDKIKAALPSPTDLLDYQGALETLGKSLGVKISVSFGAQGAASSASKGNSPTVSHTVVVDGPVGNIIEFIRAIENMPYYVQVASFKITTPQGQDKVSSANLSLKIFTDPAASTPSSKPQNLPTSL